ncbi:MAG: HAMP domain-containing sensor histidine kinase [Eubacteriales bacterium]|nr:HAMP domain-containing sensor histidine kinase [Eubacteriales bacterium]
MKLKNRLLFNYVSIFLITTLIAISAYFLFGLTSVYLDKTLVKNKYTAHSLMKDNISEIPYSNVISNNGGIQVIDANHKIIFSEGINTFPKGQLTVSEWTDFLIRSQDIRRQYSFSVAYNEKERFWLVVTFPTSIRIDFNVTHNRLYSSSDSASVVAVISVIISFYVLLLIVSTLLYSRMSASSFTKPLACLQKSADQLRNGDYSARSNLGLDNEIGDLERAFNDMAKQIQQEIDLRKKSENSRKQLTLDIAHDLKNPLAVIMGYAEYYLTNPDKIEEKHIRSIYQNSHRADTLIKNLFELSKLDSPEYRLNTVKTDLSEYLRSKMADSISMLESADFSYEFDIPDYEIHVYIDCQAMDRIINNLMENTLRYNEKGTSLTLSLQKIDAYAEIIFMDNGTGIPSDLCEDIFNPFVRTDCSRNSESGGSGLGLSIVEKIVKMHDGTILLISDVGKGCKFIIRLPLIR